VITLRGIGEMEPKNDSDFANSVTLDLDPQQNDEFQTRRAFVNLQPSSRDGELWNAMDKASDDVAKVFANSHKIDVIKNGQVIATNLDPGSLAAILPHKFSDASGSVRELANGRWWQLLPVWPDADRPVCRRAHRVRNPDRRRSAR
jgi:hypothetical protein